MEDRNKIWRFLPNGESFEMDQDDSKVLSEIIAYKKSKVVMEVNDRRVHYDSNVLNEIIGHKSYVKTKIKDRRVHYLKLDARIGRVLPPCIAKLDALEILNLKNCDNLKEIPQWIGELKNLKHLFYPCSIQDLAIPDAIGDLCKLETFVYDNPKNALYGESRTQIPTSIAKLKNLKALWVSGVRPLAEEIANLSSSLQVLRLCYYEAIPESLPACIGDFANLRTLDLTFVRSLPESIGKLANLQELRLAHMRNIKSLPESIGDLTNLKVLTIFFSGIESLPQSIGNLQGLRTLYLSGNPNLKSFPDSIGALTRLEHLNLDSAGITSLPSSVCNLPNLWLVMLEETEHLKQLPDEIGNLANLEFLFLPNSKIKSLPDFHRMKNLKKLRFLRLDGTAVETDSSFQDSVLKLASELPLLTCIGDIKCENKAKENFLSESMFFNRARSTIFHSGNQNGCSGIPASLWPLILAKDPVVFRLESWKPLETLEKSKKKILTAYLEHFLECKSFSSYQEQSDFVFRLLVEHGLNFLR